MKQIRNNQHTTRGFTIVELLIVIVVIGILAAITIVAYNGISQKAHVAVLQSDLSNARTTLELANTTNGTYPADLSSAVTAGLKASAGTTFAYTHTTSPEGYCLTATGAGVSYYLDNGSHASPTSGSCTVSIVDGSFMQTITSANCPSTMTRAVDARDNHTYWVKKLADGKCWMLTNLAYAGGGTSTYSDTDTLTNGASSAATYLVPSYYIPTSGSNVTTEPTAPSTSTTGTGQYGYLYNWCGAMGGQTSTSACANATTPAPDTSISVCPSGWRLPTGNGGEIGALNTAVNSGSSSSDAGLRSNWFSQYSGLWGGSFGDQGSYGYYWSATQGAASYGYGLELHSTESFTENMIKSSATAVRCIAI